MKNKKVTTKKQGNGTENDPLMALSMKPAAQAVLSTLTKVGRSNAADLAAYLNKPKSTIYDGLDELMKLGLVNEESDNTSRVFVLAEQEQMLNLKKARMSQIEGAFSEIFSMIEQGEKQAKVVARPRVRFYSGVEGIRQAFRDTQWNARDKETFLMWPMQEMLDTLGEEFLKQHAQGRFTHNVMLYCIQKESDRSIQNQEEHKWLHQKNEHQLTSLRFAPKDTKWNMSFWIYGDQVLFAGGGKELFAFIIRSRDFTELIKILWRQMWENSNK